MCTTSLGSQKCAFRCMILSEKGLSVSYRSLSMRFNAKRCSMEVAEKVFHFQNTFIPNFCTF